MDLSVSSAFVYFLPRYKVEGSYASEPNIKELLGVIQNIFLLIFLRSIFFYPETSHRLNSQLPIQVLILL